MAGLLSRERIVAGPGFNRWLVPPAALAIHLCIGQAYAFSVFKLPLTKILGVTESGPGDWTQKQIAWTFTIAIVFLGLSAVTVGDPAEQQPTERAQDEPDREDGQRREHRREGVRRIEELLSEERREDDVDIPVVPFDGVADAGSHDRAQRSPGCRRDGRAHRECGFDGVGGHRSLLS